MMHFESRVGVGGSIFFNSSAYNRDMWNAEVMSLKFYAPF